MFLEMPLKIRGIFVALYSCVPNAGSNIESILWLWTKTSIDGQHPNDSKHWKHWLYRVALA